MAPHPVLAGLTPQQAQAAAQSGPVLVLAGAGTGKTKALTAAAAHRIAVRGVAASRILAVTFTNKASTEMAGRIRAALGDGAAPRWIGTFHGLAARQLRIEPEVAGLRRGFDILDADDSRRVVKRVLKALNLAAGDEGVQIGRDPLKLMCNRLSKFKDSLITPEEAPARIEAMIAEARRTDTPIDPGGLRASVRVYADYQRRLRDANAADFGDLLLWPTRAMQLNPTYRARWAGRFDCVLADEYQDVNQAQYSWIRLLCADHREIFAVGDDDQAVYSWRGADSRYIRRFTRDFPGATQVRLEENFRSTAHILDAANAVIAQNHGRLGKTLFTRKPTGDPIEIVAFRNAEAEATGIVRKCSAATPRASRWDDMAVLYRSNALSRSFEEALMHARIPYALIGDVGFYQRAEIKDALALLRLAATPDDAQADEAFRRVINVPARSFGAKAMDIVEVEAAWRRVPLLVALETAPCRPKPALRGWASSTPSAVPAGIPTRRSPTSCHCCSTRPAIAACCAIAAPRRRKGRLENVQELDQLAGGFDTARELLDHAALSTGGPDEEETGRVQLMTLHKAKGLEFPHVFLPAWEAGVFPPDYGDPAEERRLAYVAITRGMHGVTISYCDYRRGPATPSLFIDGIPDRHRVAGWLHHPGAAPVPVSRRVEKLNAGELLRRF